MILLSRIISMHYDQKLYIVQKIKTKSYKISFNSEYNILI